MAAAALVVVVVPTEAMALLLCVVATADPLVATHPEAEATVVATAAAAALVAATTPTEQRPSKTMIDTARASKPSLAAVCGKSPCMTKLPATGRQRQRQPDVCSQKRVCETRGFAVFTTTTTFHACAIAFKR